VSDRISERQLSLWEKFDDKEYRDSFVSSHLANNISAQIYSTREMRGWTQQELADHAGMAQARISVMENSSYEKFSLSTLKRLASALDVALIVRLVPFSELASYATSMGPEKLAIRDFKNDLIAQVAASPRTTQAEPYSELNLADLPAGQVVVLPISGRIPKPAQRPSREDVWRHYVWDMDLFTTAVPSTFDAYFTHHLNSESGYQPQED
jgi:transcriptional regulator with XRE-family HTH domain